MPTFSPSFTDTPINLFVELPAVAPFALSSNNLMESLLRLDFNFPSNANLLTPISNGGTSLVESICLGNHSH